MSFFSSIAIAPLVGTLVYSVVGIIVFIVAFMIITWISPFSIRKEIETDQNTSLAILMGSVFIGLSIIIASAIHG